MVDNFVQRVMWRIPWQKLNKLNLLNEKANNNKKQDIFKGGAGGKDSCQGDSGGPLVVLVRHKTCKKFSFSKKDSCSAGQSFFEQRRIDHDCENKDSFRRG